MIVVTLRANIFLNTWLICYNKMTFIEIIFNKQNLLIDQCIEIRPGYFGGPCLETEPKCKDADINITKCTEKKKCVCVHGYLRDAFGCGELYLNFLPNKMVHGTDSLVDKSPNW